jgi:hypothetical protein
MLEKIEIQNNSRFKPGMRTFIIGSVRKAPQKEKEYLQQVKAILIGMGVYAHLPEDDTNQNARGIEICAQNRSVIEESNPLTLLYNQSSQGSHFDMGMGFINYKHIVPVGYIHDDSSFVGMVKRWEREGPGLKRERREEERGSGLKYIISGLNEYSSAEEIREVVEHVENLEKQGFKVYFPFRDDPIGLSKYDQGVLHREMVEYCDSVDIFYKEDNQVFFDMGLAFGSYKEATVVKNVEYDEGKSYPRMIDEWATMSRNSI